MISRLRYLYPSLHILNLLVLLGFWWQGSGALVTSGGAGMILALGRLYGLLAVIGVLGQFLLIGRAVWLEQTFGLDKLSRVHRLNGYATITFILLHPLFIVWSYAISNSQNAIAQYIDFILHYEDVLPAAISVWLFVFIVGFSIYIVRRHLKYEAWYYIHLLTYLATLLAWGHQLSLGGDFAQQLFVWYWYALYAFVLGNFVVFRFGRQLYNFWKYRFRVEKLVQETSDTTSVYITGINLGGWQAKAGQFVIVRFLDKHRFWQAHPFSLSFIPKDNHVRLTIKASGDFTAELPSLKVGTPILVDGPYGTFTKQAMTKDKLLFIAGGVGITPIRSLVEELAPQHDCILLYGSKNASDIIFKQELETLAKSYNVKIVYVLSNDPAYPGEKGTIDQEKLARLVPDAIERDIFLCGPPIMMQKVRESLAALSVPHSQIHFEAFSL